jgi:hypothetical protein
MINLPTTGEGAQINTPTVHRGDKNESPYFFYITPCKISSLRQRFSRRDTISIFLEIDITDNIPMKSK